MRTTSTDYTARKVDLGVLQYPNPSGVGSTKVVAQFGPYSNRVAGVQKLQQRYLVRLLTPQGSRTLFPQDGTSFIADTANAVGALNAIDLQHAFNFANLDLLKAFRAEQQDDPTIPDDEQLASAELTTVLVQEDTVNLTITLTSKAGTTTPVLLPLPKVQS